VILTGRFVRQLEQDDKTGIYNEGVFFMSVPSGSELFQCQVFTNGSVKRHGEAKVVLEYAVNMSQTTSTKYRQFRAHTLQIILSCS